MKAKEYCITDKEYYELRLAAAKLGMLEGAGVDNWSGYGEALYPWYGYDDLDVVEEKLKKEIFGES